MDADFVVRYDFLLETLDQMKIEHEWFSRILLTDMRSVSLLVRQFILKTVEYGQQESIQNYLARFW